ncbi:hypothetical protein BDR26DRAFT_873406 [Obelidium mucronatum]|nr:hypothetical protein BDR26DRAFT_873406 [Obelidium mucronatum]
MSYLQSLVNLANESSSVKVETVQQHSFSHFNLPQQTPAETPSVRSPMSPIVVSDSDMQIIRQQQEQQQQQQQQEEEEERNNTAFNLRQILLQQQQANSRHTEDQKEKEHKLNETVETRSPPIKRIGSIEIRERTKPIPKDDSPDRVLERQHSGESPKNLESSIGDIRDRLGGNKTNHQPEQQQQLQLDDQAVKICSVYNFRVCRPFTVCRLRHECVVCGGPHPQRSCKSHTGRTKDVCVNWNCGDCQPRSGSNRCNFIHECTRCFNKGHQAYKCRLPSIDNQPANNRELEYGSKNDTPATAPSTKRAIEPEEMASSSRTTETEISDFLRHILEQNPLASQTALPPVIEAEGDDDADAGTGVSATGPAAAVGGDHSLDFKSPRQIQGRMHGFPEAQDTTGMHEHGEISSSAEAGAEHGNDNDGDSRDTERHVSSNPTRYDFRNDDSRNDRSRKRSRSPGLAEEGGDQHKKSRSHAAEERKPNLVHLCHGFNIQKCTFGPQCKHRHECVICAGKHNYLDCREFYGDRRNCCTYWNMSECLKKVCKFNHTQCMRCLEHGHKSFECTQTISDSAFTSKSDAAAITIKEEPRRGDNDEFNPYRPAASSFNKTAYIRLDDDSSSVITERSAADYRGKADYSGHICHAFNFKPKCMAKSCRKRHVCLICQGSHRIQACKDGNFRWRKYCSLWNSGCCNNPGCNFDHICYRCGEQGHGSADCHGDILDGRL